MQWRLMRFSTSSSTCTTHGFHLPAALIAIMLWAGATPARSIEFSIDLTGKTGDEITQTFLNPSPFFASVTLSRSGVSPISLPNGFGATGFSGSFNYTQYIALEVVPNLDVTYDFSSITFRLLSPYDSNTYQLQFASSVDSFASKQTIVNGQINPSQLAVATPNWPEAQTGTTSFRLYAQSFSASVGLISSSPAITFEGTAVPEPASLALVLGGCCWLAARRSRPSYR